MTAAIRPKRADGTRQQRKGDQTRQSILDAARECFNTLGVNNVTCRTIAAHLQLSPGNVYYYFANKEEILLELHKNLERVAEASLEASEARGLDTPDAQRESTQQWLDLVWEWRFIFLDIHQLVRDNPNSRKDMRAMQQRSVQLHQGFFEKHLMQRGLELTEKDRKFCHDLAVANWIVAVHWLQNMCLEKGEQAITKAEFDASINRFMTIGRIIYDEKLIERLHQPTQ